MSSGHITLKQSFVPASSASEAKAAVMRTLPADYHVREMVANALPDNWQAGGEEHYDND